MRLIECVAIFVLVVANVFAIEEEVYIVSAAGYKAPVNEIIDLYEKDSCNKINAVFGNMKMITTYVQQSDNVSLIIGDSNFINKSKIKLKKSVKIGNGKLLMVYQANTCIQSIQDLVDEKIKRIGIPDPKKAIYGKAAVELLKSEGIYKMVQDKLIILKTVPQVSAYLKSGDIEVGLINVTNYIKIKDDNLKFIEIDSELYSEIIIQAGLINDKAINIFEFLSSDKARKVFIKYGL